MWWIWILIAIVVVAALAVGIGLVRARRRRVSIVPQQGPQPARPGADAPSARGGYRAGGSISFAVGGSSTTEAPPASAAAAPTAPAEPQAAVPATAAEPAIPPAGAVPGTATPAEPGPAGGAIDGDLGGGAGLTAPVDNVPSPDEGSGTDEAASPIDAARAEEIAPAAGRLARLRGRLVKSQSTFGRSLLGLLGGSDLDDDSWQDVEDTLLMADLGSSVALRIAQTLRDRVAADGVADAAAARALLRSVLVEAVGPDTDRAVRALAHADKPAVVLMVGVNGTGKTTTTGKLARVLVADGHSVVLGAADTFRAAAAEQLATWAERSGSAIVRGAEGADPAAVAFDAVKKGIEAGADVVLIDTAGRLHTKTGLMDELGKVKRVIEKQAAVDEVLLVLDATTGQNGLTQAKVFAEVVDVTGVVLTKLDGTAKGGIVLAVQQELGVPVKLVGLGEGPDDLAPFEAGAFVDALLGD